MLEQIKKCKNCKLYQNQQPLIDNKTKCDVMWVGLSAKKVKNLNEDYPLKEDTNSGKIIKEIETKLPNINYYKTNLVKCLPLDKNKKIRYPSKKEMQACINNLIKEIEVLKPKIIFLLGNNVSTYIEHYFKQEKISINSKIKKIKHPSYIYIYRKKEKQDYIESIVKIIKGTNKEVKQWLKTN